MQGIDHYPTHLHGEYEIRPGRPRPFGATLVPGGINFSVFSRHASYCVLVLFEKRAEKPLVEIPFRGFFERPGTKEPVWGDFRVGNVFSMTVFGLDHERIEYGFRMHGPFDTVPRGQPGHHRFDATKILLDPFARAIGGRDAWGAPPASDGVYAHRAGLVLDDFDWESDRALEIPVEDLVIYEMHVRGFTLHDSSEVSHPGTFAAIREKIPYLRDLGVNCVELMPVFEFDELENDRRNPATGERLLNYWGYSPIGFFAPKAGYAATGKTRDGTMIADELKTLVKELHRNGIEVMLDVVFNHTAEGNEDGPTVSFRGLDNATYYMMTPEGFYQNFSGTGNTLNCNHSIVRGMVLESLQYWVSEYHIDGFRFDLAAILGRDQDGVPLANPPLLEALAHDPVLARCKLIAEAWDAGGLYQVGSFPAYGRWMEWNGKFRDAVRRFVKGDAGLVSEIAERLQGSPDLYLGRGSTASVNFVTCHDGFTLADLYAYDRKHNEANGEENRDGCNDNHSWNCGIDGETADPGVLRLRRRLMKNAAALLLLSRGVPMIQMGDEVGRTQRGNNNAYCHDGELSWLDWSLVDTNRDLFRFFKNLIAFRRRHVVLRGREHHRSGSREGGGLADISWHGLRPWKPDWSAHVRTLAFMLCDKPTGPGDGDRGESIYVAMNMHWEPHDFEAPALPDGRRWFRFLDTDLDPPDDILDPGGETELPGTRYTVGPRTVVVLVGR